MLLAYGVFNFWCFHFFVGHAADVGPVLLAISRMVLPG
jgi:hypothetical protein